MHEFCYDYIKSKYQNNAKLCYMDTDIFIIYIKTEYFDKDIADDVKIRYGTSDYEVDRLLPKGMNIKVMDLIKDELGRKIIVEFVTLRPKTYSYLTDDDKNDKKAEGTKKVCKRILKFNDYKDCLFKNEIILNHNKDLKVKNIVYILKNSIRLH